MRTFIAAEIPLPIQKSIQHQVDHLRNLIGDSSVRWVPVQNIHLTLKFFGDISHADMDVINKIVRIETQTHSSFDIAIGGLGSFPNSKRARVLWIRIQAPAELEALQRGIESACTRAGFRPETRPFSPHLTIGRIRRDVSSSDQIKIHKALTEIKIDLLGTARVDSIHLFKSELKPSGAIYTKLYSAPLHNRGEN